MASVPPVEAVMEHAKLPPGFVFLLYLLTVPVFFAMDMLWLGWLAADFYQHQIGHLLAEPNWMAAVAFYLLYIVGILGFAVLPGLARGSLMQALRLAAAFGFFTYVTYELTNMATLPDWPLRLVVVDTLWGMTLCVSVTAISYRLGVMLRKSASG
jgi:uncharacterized membrane protein